MKKKIINIFIIINLFILIIISFFNHKIVYLSVLESSKIFIDKVFPFLFIMMIINNLLVNINFPYYFNRTFKNPSLYIFIMSTLSGSPINALILKDFLDKKYISEQSASLALCFTTLNNPLFLYNYFNLIFHNKLIIMKLFLALYLSNIMLFIILFKKIDSNKFNLSFQNYNLKNALIESIKKALNNLLNIFAIITFFKLLCDLLMPKITLVSLLLRGLVEITQGLNSLITINISLKLKELLLLVILCFNGFSIHIQMANILNDYSINYKYFYLSRLVLIILTSLYI